MKVYVASRFRNKPLVREATAVLAQQGIDAFQTWPEEAPDTEISKAAIARKDLDEIDRADAVIVLTQDCELVPGGMHFEAGYAWGRGQRVIVVGPSVNIFYEMAGIEHAADVEAAGRMLKQAA